MPHHHVTTQLRCSGIGSFRYSRRPRAAAAFSAPSARACVSPVMCLSRAVESGLEPWSWSVLSSDSKGAMSFWSLSGRAPDRGPRRQMSPFRSAGRTRSARSPRHVCSSQGDEGQRADRFSCAQLGPGSRCLLCAARRRGRRWRLWRSSHSDCLCADHYVNAGVSGRVDGVPPEPQFRDGEGSEGVCRVRSPVARSDFDAARLGRDSVGAGGRTIAPRASSSRHAVCLRLDHCEALDGGRQQHDRRAGQGSRHVRRRWSVPGEPCTSAPRPPRVE